MRGNSQNGGQTTKSLPVSYTHLDVYKRQSLKDAKPGEKFQFVRTGFFTPDSKNPGVYNRVVTLRDSFKPCLLYTSRCV